MERRGALSRDYLHRCRDLHAQVTEIRYGRAQDLARIEKAVARIRSARRLTYDDIARILDDEALNADAFGYFPPRDEVESILESTEWDLWNLPKREEKAISKLLQVYRQIEPVSVILRFFVPKHYGIMSPPVEKVLGLGPLRHRPERYQAYLKNLRDIRDDRGFKTTAEVDMALWVLQLGVLDDMLADHLPRNEYEALQNGFRRDSKLREIRVGNLTRQIFSDMTRVELAEALLATNVELAGQVAGIEFERSVKRLTRSKPNDKTPLKKLVDDMLPDRIHENFQDKNESTKLIIECMRAVDTRNNAIHPDRPPRKEAVEALIRTMKEIKQIEETQCRRPRVSSIEPPHVGAGESSTAPEGFWREHTIDELAVAQEIVVPQQIGNLFGAAADLWDDEDDFRFFVEGIHKRRIEDRKYDKENG